MHWVCTPCTDSTWEKKETNNSCLLEGRSSSCWSWFSSSYIGVYDRRRVNFFGSSLGGLSVTLSFALLFLFEPHVMQCNVDLLCGWNPRFQCILFQWQNASPLMIISERLQGFPLLYVDSGRIGWMKCLVYSEFNITLEYMYPWFSLVL